MEGAVQPEDVFFVPTFTQSKALLQKPLLKNDVNIDGAVFPDSHSSTQTASDPIARDFAAVKLNVPSGPIKQSHPVYKETKPQSFTNTVDTGPVVEEGSDYSLHMQECNIVPEPKQAYDLGLRSSDEMPGVYLPGIPEAALSDVISESSALTDKTSKAALSDEMSRKIPETGMLLSEGVSREIHVADMPLSEVGVEVSCKIPVCHYNS